MKEPIVVTKQETSPRQTPALALSELVCLVTMLLAVTAVIYFDAIVLQNNLSESSLTEYSHNLICLLSSAVFAIGAYRHPEKRGYLTLVSTLFAIFFIRECDALLDQISHGFWKYPASAVLIIGGLITSRWRSSITQPFLHHFFSRSFSYLLIGFLLVVVYSRIMGSGYFWRAALDADYSSLIKGIVQESIELLGYAILLFGTVLSSFHGFEKD